jgi:hypothetical protein
MCALLFVMFDEDLKQRAGRRGQWHCILHAADTGMVLPIGSVPLDGMGNVGLSELPSEDRVVPGRSD